MLFVLILSLYRAFYGKPQRSWCFNGRPSVAYMLLVLSEFLNIEHVHCYEASKLAVIWIYNEQHACQWIVTMGVSEFIKINTHAN